MPTPEEQLADLRRRAEAARENAARQRATADGLQERIQKIEASMAELGADSPKRAREMAEKLRGEAQEKINQARERLEAAR